MTRLALLGGVSVGLGMVSLARGHVQPYFTPVTVSADALAADPELANFECWDLRVVVAPTPGSSTQDRFQVATFDAPLSIGSFYSPVGGGDIPVIPTTANLSFDTYVTVPFYQAGQEASLIPIPGGSDALGNGTHEAIFPRAGEQQSRLSVTWGTFNPTLYSGDYEIARFTVSRNATGPVAGYVLSRDTNSLDQYNYATLSFNNGALVAAPGSEFALAGDANRDNQVDTSDFAAVALNFGKSAGTWARGDFNGDGVTNALDFNAIASNFGTNSGAPSLSVVVPEPVEMGLLGCTLWWMSRRRR